jgi:Uncharacterised nucleotidyltransferase
MNETTSATAASPPKALHLTLRKITETLARELASPSHSAPDWSDFEWTIARAVAAMHGVSPLLSHTLAWQGPAGWRPFLEQQRAHTATRHARIDDLLRRIDQRSREAGIAVLALKGAALHAMGLYTAGDRPMADIDLLVRREDAASSAGMLESLGYREGRKSWKERVFNPAVEHAPDDLGEHSDGNIKLELHERICERLPWRITDVSDFIFPTEPRPGLNAYPSKASLMVHLLLHAAGSMATQALRLLQLHDIVLLSTRMTQADWDDVLARGSRGSGLWWAYPPLALTARYYTARIPPGVLAALAGECSYLLKRAANHATLYDVSYSYLWVDAFPGIEWSQSLRDILSYAASRVWPDGKHLALRASVAKSQGWVSQSQWAPLSQGGRILRWITSRPTRPLTMHAVRAALAQAR